MADNSLPLLRREDFAYTFESAGTNFLFEDIVNSYYMTPMGESISLWRENKRTFTAKKDMVRCREEGLRRTIAETVKCISALTRLVDDTLAKTISLRDAQELSREDLLTEFARLKRMCEFYVYFDAAYWDGVYEKSKGDPVSAEHVVLVQNFKNVIRNRFEPVFFEKDSYFLTLINKLASQFNLSERDIQEYREQEVLALFDDKRVADDELDSRRRAYVFYVSPTGIIEFFTGLTAERFISTFDKEELVAGVEFKGTSAHKIGRKVTARVRIIRRNYGDAMDTKRQMDAMIEGEVLVSETTEPELIPAFKKASAVVTDIGGMLSHAAITSREMNLPCIVGTGNASKILKTGDLIEVDAEKGTVRILDSDGHSALK